MTNPKYPDGKLNPQDEGQLTVVVREDNGTVRIDFRKPVAWCAMRPQEAANFAATIIKHAKLIARARGEVLTVLIE